MNLYEIPSKDLQKALGDIVFSQYFKNKDVSMAIKEFLWDMDVNSFIGAFEDELKEWFKEQQFR